MIRTRVSLPIVCLVSAMAATSSVSCSRKPPDTPALATPTVRFNHDRAPAGSPIEVTYRFVVAPNAQFGEDYRVFVHVLDSDQEVLWFDDHDPPVPTKQWQPGQTVEYTRTVFVPVVPYIGDITIQMGLHSVKDQKRQPLAGVDAGQRAYKVGQLRLLPQTDNLFTVFKDGWHQAEVATQNAAIEWQWTKGEGTVAFKNPKKDAALYLDLDSPGSAMHQAQQVQVVMGAQTLEQFSLPPDQRFLKKIALPAAQMGTGELSELQIRVDKTFVPAVVTTGGSKDPRELGVRVFHAFIDAR